MELIRKQIYMNRRKCKSSIQMTLDDDFNVPDSKPDIARLLKTDGEIKIADKKQTNGKLLLSGMLLFRILYISEDAARPLHTIRGELPFNEAVSLNENCTGDNLNVSWEFEDLTAGIINSRKFTIRSLIQLTITGDELNSQDVAVGISNSPELFYRKEELALTGIAVNRKDSFRIREDITLPNAKPAIGELLYYELRPYNTNIHLAAECFNISADLSVFICYLAENGTTVPEYYETEIPVTSSIECPGCTDNMIPNIIVQPVSRSLEVKPDADGEERRLEAELTMDLSIRLFEEQELSIINDLYSLRESVTPEFTPNTFETLLQRNNSRLRITDSFNLPAALPKLLQICHCSGTVKTDSVQAVPEGILAEGAVDISIFYITAEDARPLEVITKSIPFSHTIEINGITPDCHFEVHACPEQISAMISDKDTLDIKAGISFDTIAFCTHQKDFLTAVHSADANTGACGNAPFMYAYTVKAEDSLWDIAKHFMTTEDSIREINELTSDAPLPGEMLLIVRESSI